MDPITALAEATTHPRVAPWVFVPTGEFLVNDSHENLAHIGEVFFKSPDMITHAAIQAQDWVFCLVRHVEDDSPENEWIVAGFHGDSISFFAEVHGDPDPRTKFCLFVVNRFWPLLFGAQSGLKVGEEFRVGFRIGVLGDMQRTYTKRGGVEPP